MPLVADPDLLSLGQGIACAHTRQHVVAGNQLGSEIEHPMSVVILGGVITSTVLPLLGMPALYWAFGRKKPDPAV